MYFEKYRRSKIECGFLLLVSILKFAASLFNSRPLPPFFWRGISNSIQKIFPQKVRKSEKQYEAVSHLF